jgi:hypothetical protein
MDKITTISVGGEMKRPISNNTHELKLQEVIDMIIDLCVRKNRLICPPGFNEDSSYPCTKNMGCCKACWNGWAAWGRNDG